LFVRVTILIESILVEEEDKVNVEFLQIQVPLVPVVELALLRRL